MLAHRHRQRHGGLCARALRIRLDALDLSPHRRRLRRAGPQRARAALPDALRRRHAEQPARHRAPATPPTASRSRRSCSTPSSSTSRASSRTPRASTTATGSRSSSASSCRCPGPALASAVDLPGGVHLERVPARAPHADAARPEDAAGRHLRADQRVHRRLAGGDGRACRSPSCRSSPIFFFCAEILRPQPARASASESVSYAEPRRRSRHQGLRRLPRHRGRELRGRARRVHRHGRPVGLRQVDAAADHRRARADHLRADRHRRPRRHRATSRPTAASPWSSRTTPSTRT